MEREPARKSKRSRNTRSRLIDVARLAGVSLGSASRALSNPEAVKPKTRNAVRDAAKQLSYVPDGTARSLALRRSFTVGAILPTLYNPVFADFVHALQQTLGGEKYALLVSAHEYDSEAEVAITERLLQRGVDGLILVGTDHDPRVIAQLEHADIPYLFTWSTDEAAGRPCIGFHNRRAMQQLAQHLIKLGHRRFAMLSGLTQFNERARARIDGVIDALSLSGIQLLPQNILQGAFSVQAGRDGLRRVLVMKPTPTALICGADMIAAGALAEAREAKINVPGQLSISGFDNIVYASLLSPQLTTVNVPSTLMGQKAGEGILASIKGLKIESCVLDTQFLGRGSTGPPPRAAVSSGSSTSK